ncbi:hypothetical protein [Shimazuella alba]|uniref:Uncharacterized protein n=1 Tax=Shimazuella alba TaxID=2690964 RepID=A0A6I4VQI5_9BACL|nr:hypothetical protein [Shimazuella alba]MXQ52638.1 hypothetical protein [Shimazuella alba]
MNKYDQARQVMINDILEISEEYTQNDLEKMGFLLLELFIEKWKTKTDPKISN